MGKHIAHVISKIMASMFMTCNVTKLRENPKILSTLLINKISQLIQGKLEYLVKMVKIYGQSASKLLCKNIINRRRFNDYMVAGLKTSRYSLVPSERMIDSRIIIYHEISKNNYLNINNQ